jgi:hypothetical protein
MVGSDTDLLSKQRHRSDLHLSSLWRGDGLGGGAVSASGQRYPRSLEPVCSSETELVRQALVGHPMKAVPHCRLHVVVQKK